MENHGGEIEGCGLNGYWDALDQLVAESTIRIDRPAGTAHPRFPKFIYPLDYGYLEGTKADDGNEIDVWRGTLPEIRVTGVVCTVDMLKRDVEVKLLIGCTRQEASLILATHNSGPQSAVWVERPILEKG
jgi:inorganic pyrophosphatase